MRIKNNRMFPYPVLSSMYDDYLNCDFTIQLNAIRTKKEVRLEITPIIKSVTLINLLKSQKCKIVLHLECSKTKYRKVQDLSLTTNYIDIKAPLINQNLEVIAFIIANQDIYNFKSLNNEFNPEYGTIGFNIEKYSILAISNQPDISVPKDIYDLSNINSIVSVIPDYDEKNNMTISLTDSKIRISLPSDTYGYYASIGQTENVYTPIIHSLFVLPAIIYALDYLKSLESWIDYESYIWFKVIKKKIEEKYKVFDKNLIEDVTSVVLAQNLINSPVPLATSTLLKMEVKK